MLTLFDAKRWEGKWSDKRMIVNYIDTYSDNLHKYLPRALIQALNAPILNVGLKAKKIDKNLTNMITFAYF